MRALLLLSSLFAVAGAADEPIFPDDPQLERLWHKGVFTEGPAYGPDHCVYFSDIGTRIMKFDPRTGETTVFRDPSGRSNGLYFDGQGRLHACEGATTGGTRRVTRTEKDGTVKPIAERWQGKRFNSPNDLVIDAKGRVFFTDPRYVGDEPREIDTESVYRVDPDGTVTQVITDVEKPNGIILTPDGKTMYLADSNPRGNRHLLRFDVKEDGSVGPKRLLHDFGKDRGVDGMTMDTKGRVYAAAGRGKSAGITVFDSDGKKLAFLPTPEDPTNCCFGGKDRDVLYVTAGRSLYRIQINAKGFAQFWPGKK